MTKLILDTNVYIDWFNRGVHKALVEGSGFVRYLSSVVQMELRTGAVTRASYSISSFVPTPPPVDWLLHRPPNSIRLDLSFKRYAWRGGRYGAPRWSTTC